MVPLGWIGGTCGLILAAAISMYANALLGRLHEIGGKRHIRYRDLAGHIYGTYSYTLSPHSNEIDVMFNKLEIALFDFEDTHMS